MTESNGNWVRVRCQEMILLELDYALGTYLYAPNRRYLNEEQVAIFRELPNQWLQDAERYLPDLDECMMVFEMLALLAPEVLEMAYPQASARLRALSVDTLRAALHPSDAPQAIPDSTAELLLALVMQRLAPYRAVYQEYPKYQQRFSRTAHRLAALIDQPKLLHAFWDWVDQFVYQHYLPWRETQGAVLQRPCALLMELENRAGRYDLQALLARLPKTNALHYRARLRAYLLEDACELVLWQEPFGLFDSWSILHNKVIVSTAEPGALFTSVKEEILEIAEKSSALSDPTRLGILRLIRHFDMDISELADYFGLSKPTVSVHVKKLREAGLVTSYQDGNSLRHKLNAAHLQALFKELEVFLDLDAGGEPGKK